MDKIQTIHSVNGKLIVKENKSDLLHVEVLGVDILLKFKDGTQLLAHQLGLEAVSGNPPSVVFADTAIPSPLLLSVVGKVEDPALHSSITPIQEITSFDGGVKQTKKSLADAMQAQDESTSKSQATEQHSAQDLIQVDPAVKSQAQKLPLTQMVKEVSPIFTESSVKSEVSIKSYDTPIAKNGNHTSALSGSNSNGTTGSKGAFYEALNGGGGNGSITIAAKLFNLVGVTKNTDGSKIFGSGGAAGSDTNASSSAQFASQSIVADGGNKTIISNNPDLIGAGFAKVLNFQITEGTLANVAISAISLDGLPEGFVVVGATKINSVWLISGNKLTDSHPSSLSITIQYTGVADSAVFKHGEVFKSFEIKAGFTLADGTYQANLTRTFKAQLSEVSEIGDLNNAGDILVFPARGIGTDIAVTDGTNIIEGGIGRDSIIGGKGNDTIVQSGNDDVIDGGGGFNTYDASLSSTSIQIVRASSNDESVTSIIKSGATDKLKNIQSFVGGGVADNFTGSDLESTFDGKGGNDVIVGGSGKERFIVSAGTDTITKLGAGGDTLEVASGAQANAELGSDWTAHGSNNGTVAIHANGHSVDLSDVTGTKWVVTNDDIGGTESTYGITLKGSNNGDVLKGGRGDDTLIGGSAKDTLQVSLGNDVLDGGDGVDTADFTTLNADLIVNLGSHNYGSVNTKTATFSGNNQSLNSIERILGASNASNTFYGDVGDKDLNLVGGNQLDKFTLIDSSLNSIDGKDGVDTVYLDGSGINSFSFLASHVKNVEVFDYRSNSIISSNNANALTISSSDIESLVKPGGEILIRGNANDSIQFASDPNLSSSAFDDQTKWVQRDGVNYIAFKLTTHEGGVDVVRSVLVEQVMNVKSTTEPPELELSAGNPSGDKIWLAQGASTYFGSSQLKASQTIEGSHDLPGTGTSTVAGGLYFKITGVVGGTLQGIYDLPASIGGQGFTQEDINNLKIKFVADSSSATAASISFLLSDGINIQTNPNTVTFTVMNTASLTSDIWNFYDPGTDKVDGLSKSVWQDAILRFASTGSEPNISKTTVSSLSYTRPTDRSDEISDILVGAKVATTFVAGSGKQIVIGQQGFSNTYDVSAAKDLVEVDLSKQTNGYSHTSITGDGYGSQDSLKNIDNIIGGAGINHLVGNANKNILTGGAVADTLTGGGGDDTLTGGGGADTFEIDAGTDFVTDLGIGADIVNVSKDASLVAELKGNWIATSDTFSLGNATLTIADDSKANVSNVSLADVSKSSTAGWTVDLSKSSQGVTITGSGAFDSLTGSAYSDTINVRNTDFNSIDGGIGFDTLKFTDKISLEFPFNRDNSTDRVKYQFVDTNLLKNIDRLDFSNGQSDLVTLNSSQIQNLFSNFNYSSVAINTVGTKNVLEIYADATDKIYLLGASSVGEKSITDATGTYNANVYRYGTTNYVVIKGATGIVDTTAPAVVAPTAATVMTGSSIVFNGSNSLNSLLKATDDVATSNEILYTIRTTPTLGALKLNNLGLSVGDIFTQADVDSGALKFEAGATAGGDSFTFTVSDRQNESTTKTENISILDVSGLQSNSQAFSGISFTGPSGTAVNTYAGNLWSTSLSKSAGVFNQWGSSFKTLGEGANGQSDLTYDQISLLAGANPVLLLDASNQSTLITSSGKVTDWNNLAGSTLSTGVHQVGAGSVVYDAQAFGGRGALSFDGKSDFQGEFNQALGSAGEATIFVVSMENLNSWASTIGQRGIFYTPTSYDVIAALSKQTSSQEVFAGASEIKVTTSATGVKTATLQQTAEAGGSSTYLVQDPILTSVPQVVAVSYSGTSVSSYVSGSLSGYGTRPLGAGSTVFDIGALPSSSGITSGIYGFSGDIGEVLVFDTALTAAQISDVSTYLGLKWGLSYLNYSFGPYSYNQWRDATIQLGTTGSGVVLNAKGFKAYNPVNSGDPNNGLVSDVLIAGDGLDYLRGGAGNDVMILGTHGSVYISNGNDFISGGEKASAGSRWGWASYDGGTATSNLKIDTLHLNGSGYGTVTKGYTYNSTVKDSLGIANLTATGVGLGYVGTDWIQGFGIYYTGSGDDLIIAQGNIYAGTGKNTIYTFGADTGSSVTYINGGKDSRSAASGSNILIGSASTGDTVYFDVNTFSSMTSNTNTFGTGMVGKNLLDGGADNTANYYSIGPQVSSTNSNIYITANFDAGSGKKTANLTVEGIDGNPTLITNPYWGITYSDLSNSTYAPITDWIRNLTPVIYGGTLNIRLAKTTSNGAIGNVFLDSNLTNPINYAIVGIYDNGVQIEFTSGGTTSIRSYGLGTYYLSGGTQSFNYSMNVSRRVMDFSHATGMYDVIDNPDGDYITLATSNGVLLQQVLSYSGSIKILSAGLSVNLGEYVSSGGVVYKVLTTGTLGNPNALTTQDYSRISSDFFNGSLTDANAHYNGSLVWSRGAYTLYGGTVGGGTLVSTLVIYGPEMYSIDGKMGSYLNLDNNNASSRGGDDTVIVGGSYIDNGGYNFNFYDNPNSLTSTSYRVLDQITYNAGTQVGPLNISLGNGKDYLQLTVSQAAAISTSYRTYGGTLADPTIRNLRTASVDGGLGIDNIHFLNAGTLYDLGGLVTQNLNGATSTVDTTYKITNFEVLDFSNAGLQSVDRSVDNNQIIAKMSALRLMDIGNGTGGGALPSSLTFSSNSILSLKLDKGDTFKIVKDDGVSDNIYSISNTTGAYDQASTVVVANGLAGTLYKYYTHGASQIDANLQGQVHIVKVDDFGLTSYNDSHFSGDYLSSMVTATSLTIDFNKNDANWYNATSGDYKISDSNMNVAWTKNAGTIDFTHSTANTLLVYGAGVTNPYANGISANVILGQGNDYVLVDGSYDVSNNQNPYYASVGSATLTAQSGITGNQVKVNLGFGDDTIQISKDQLSNLATNSVDGGAGGIDSIHVMSAGGTFDLGGLVANAATVKNATTGASTLDTASSYSTKVVNFEVLDFSDNGSGSDSISSSFANLQALDFTNPSPNYGSNGSSAINTLVKPITIKLDSGEHFSITGTATNGSTVTSFNHTNSDTSTTTTTNGGFDEVVTQVNASNQVNGFSSGMLYNYYASTDTAHATLLASVHLV